MIIYDNYQKFLECKSVYKKMLEINSEYKQIDEIAMPFKNCFYSLENRFNEAIKLLNCSKHELEETIDESKKGKTYNKLLKKKFPNDKFLYKPVKLYNDEDLNYIEYYAANASFKIYFNNLAISTAYHAKGIYIEQTFDLKNDYNNNLCLLYTNYIKFKNGLKNMEGTDNLVIDFKTKKLICVYNHAENFLYFNDGDFAFVINGNLGVEVEAKTIVYSEEYNKKIDELDILREMNNEERKTNSQIVYGYLNHLKD